jgi:RNA polymerase sigma factor for flagellar operon FliA
MTTTMTWNPTPKPSPRAAPSVTPAPVPQTSANRPPELIRTPADRAALARQHASLVRRIARRIHMRLPPSVELDDLVNEGTVGLLEAIDRYDAQRGVPLHLFARRRITGAILDLLRDLDGVPRAVRARADQIDEARAALRASWGRNPGRGELAQAMGIAPHELDHAARSAEIWAVASLDAPISPEQATPLVDTVPSSQRSAEDEVGDAELGQAMEDALTRLPEREQRAVRGFYLEGRPLLDLSAALGITPSRVSQLHRAGVERLRHKLLDSAA